MFRKKGRVIALVGLVLLFLIILSLFLQLEFPGATGSHAVGRASRQWVDATRQETLTDRPDDFRETPVQIWYPTDEKPVTSAPYFPGLGQVAQSMAASGEVSPIEVFGLRLIRAHERPGANISAAQQKYPVILLSPGNGTNVEFYTGIAEELASYGYIVIGINHPYDVAAVALQDGSVAQFNPGPIALPDRQKWVAERVGVRTADVLFVLSELDRLKDSGDNLLSEHIDLDHVGVMGHSLGGITAAQACRAEPRLRACLNLDGIQRGGPFSTEPNPTPPVQPFMLITKEKQLPQAMIDLFKGVRSGSYLVVINDATHDSFTDGPILIPSLLPTPNAADRILGLTRVYTLAFFDQALQGQPGSLLAKATKNSQVSLDVFPAQ